MKEDCEASGGVFYSRIGGQHCKCKPDEECVRNNHTSGKINPATGEKHFGRCQAHHIYFFGFEKFCYVDVPSRCTDVKASKIGGNYYISAEACKQGPGWPGC